MATSTAKKISSKTVKTDSGKAIKGKTTNKKVDISKALQEYFGEIFFAVDVAIISF